MQSLENLKKDIDQTVVTAQPGQKNGFSALLPKLKKQKEKKSSYSVFVELVAVIAVLAFCVFNKGSNNNSFLSETVQAYVIDSGTVNYIGDDEKYKNLKYFVLFQYKCNGREYTKRLLYESDPGLKVGTNCSLKVSKINPEEILE